MIERKKLRPPARRVIIYARVSRDHRQGRSVRQQLEIGRRIARDQGWEIVAEYSDNDRSASRYAAQPREDWPKVEADIENGLADVLWVWEISRGTRDMEVWARLSRVAREQRMWIGLDEDLWDTTNPSHMRYLNSQMVDAVYESDKTQTRIERDLTAHAERGGPHSPVGFAYIREYDPKSGALIRQVPHPVHGPIVREAGMRLLAGHELASYAHYLNSAKIRTHHGYLHGEPMFSRKTGEPLYDPNGHQRRAMGWSPQVLRNMLRSPTLMGRRGHLGEIVGESQWEGIFSPEEWWSIQAILEARMRDSGRENRAKYLASGIGLCPCSGRLATMQKRNGAGKVVGRRYRCDPKTRPPGYDGPHVSRDVAMLDGHIEALLVAEFSMPDVLDRFRDPTSSPEALEAAREAASRLRVELERLYDDVGAGRRTARMAEAEEQRLLREIDAADAAARPAPLQPLAEELADDNPKAVLRTWRGWSLEQKRSALRAFTRRIELLPLASRGLIGRAYVMPSESVRITWVGE